MKISRNIFPTNILKWGCEVGLIFGLFKGGGKGFTLLESLKFFFLLFITIY